MSPDGGKIVYTWVPAGGAGPEVLILMNINGTDMKRLAETAR